MFLQEREKDIAEELKRLVRDNVDILSDKDGELRCLFCHIVETSSERSDLNPGGDN